jgi:predicted aspartyl protease
MIPGAVNGNLEATIRLQVRGPGGQEQEVEAVIDTGFNGFLTLSPGLVRRLGLPHIGQR